MSGSLSRLRMGIVGGGAGSFIGPVHRMAAQLDGRIDLVAGALSSDPDAAVRMGRSIGLPRAYASLSEMLTAEKGRPDGIDFVTIATPNFLHAPMTRDVISAGFHVFCDKPAAANGREMLALAPFIRASDRHYALAHVYLGYPLVRHARAMCRDGELGEIRSVVVEYFQGWLSESVELSGNKQAEWRADPARAGIGGCVADIGVHAFNLAEFVTGLKVDALNADLLNAGPGRRLDDGCNMLLRFQNGAKGVLAASQIATGARNGLRLRVHGTRASLDWRQESPDTLVVTPISGPTLTYHAGAVGLSTEAADVTRLPPGHPEGFIEALANLYRDFGALLSGDAQKIEVQGVDAALRGMAFIETAIASSRSGVWQEVALAADETVQ